MFGHAVAMSPDGRVAVVGAYSYDGTATNQGALYVYTVGAVSACKPMARQATEYCVSGVLPAISEAARPGARPHRFWSPAPRQQSIWASR